PPRTRRTHADSGRLQIGTSRFSPHPGLLLDAPQRPSQSSQGYYLLSFRFAQDVAHADRSYNTSCRNQRPRLLLSLAGFQVTLIGRFWVTPEAQRPRHLHAHDRESASLSGSVQSANFPSWDSLARKLASVGVGEGELQKAKRELDVNRYYSITGVSLSPVQIELLGFIRKPVPTPR